MRYRDISKPLLLHPINKYIVAIIAPKCFSSKAAFWVPNVRTMMLSASSPARGGAILIFMSVEEPFPRPPLCEQKLKMAAGTMMCS